MVGVRRGRRVGCSVCGRGGEDGGAVGWVGVLGIEIGHDGWWMFRCTVVMFILGRMKKFDGRHTQWPMGSGSTTNDAL